jgi:hypothetical protein
MADTDLQEVLSGLQEVLPGQFPGILTVFFLFLRNFTRLFFQNSNYDILSNWCQYCSGKSCRWLKSWYFLSDWDAAAVVRTCYSLDKIDQYNLRRITGHRYLLDCHRHRGLRACRSIRCLCIPWSFKPYWILLYAVHFESTKQCAFVRNT